MNLVIDLGNTRTKAALFHGQQLKEKFIFTVEAELLHFLQQNEVEHVLISSVSRPAGELLPSIKASGKKIILQAGLPVPVSNNYATPHTLGVDRLAAACGAFAEYPYKNCLVIDAGTCINYEFIDAQGTYQGGAISPGISMRFEAMHKFTARLPLVHVDKEIPLIGDSTETCMQSGVLHGTLAEADGIIDQYMKIYPELVVILCGGDASLFENRLKHRIFVAPDLILKGLNSILLYNVSI